MIALAVSGESLLLPGAFLTGENSSARSTSNTTRCLDFEKISKIKDSSLIPVFSLISDLGTVLPSLSAYLLCVCAKVSEFVI